MGLILLLCAEQAAPLPSKRARPRSLISMRRARAGERLNVVFFGASLTWAPNASDPNLTSYRGLVARRLEEAYPQAR